MKVLFITDCAFPGSAMASRLLSFSYMFNDLGYDVHIFSTKTDDKKLICNKLYKEDKYTYQIIDSNRSYRIQSFLGNEKLKAIIEQYLNNNNVDLVFSTSMGSNFKDVLRICKKLNIKLLLEQCEWFDYSSFGLKKLDPRFIRFTNNINNNFIKVDGVISISRLLYDYYQSKNVKTIRIPSILDIKNKPYQTKLNNNKINLVYTGNTSKSKELLKPILEALACDKKYLDNFVFNIYGSNKEELLNNIGNDNDLFNKAKDVINIYGKVPQKEIESILLKSDYQIFIRPIRRSSNAGFPTKLAESMAVGTPVISNITGDIDLYLKDGVNCFLCKGNTNEDIKEVLDKILNMNDKTYSNMRQEARKTAENSFDYTIYTKQLENFIKEL